MLIQAYASFVDRLSSYILLYIRYSFKTERSKSFYRLEIAGYHETNKDSKIMVSDCNYSVLGKYFEQIRNGSLGQQFNI